MGMPVAVVWTQEDYAFYSDGTESGATIIGSAGAQQNVDVDVAFHCRILVADTAGATNNDPDPALTVRLQYNLAAGGWNTVTGATPVQYVNNANLTDGGTTTNRDPTGTGTFNAGRVYEAQNDSATVYTTPDNGNTTHTEIVFHLQIDSGQVTNGQEILLRCVEGDGTAFGGTYTNADLNVVESADVNVTTNAPQAMLVDEKLATIAYDVDISTNAPQAMVVAEQQATITHDVDISTNLQALSVAEQTATITHPVDITTNLDELTIATQTADISYGVNIETNAPQAMSVAEQTATITHDVDISTNLDALSLAEQTATITHPVGISAGVDALTLSEQTATITYDVDITTGAPQSLIVATQQATIDYSASGVNIPTNLAALTLTTQTASITHDIDITTNLDSLVVATHQASISLATPTDGVKSSFSKSAKSVYLRNTRPY